MTTKAGWIEDFKVRYGRAPRILHIGNIANNAYNNAKLLTEAGLTVHVMCYDYYHVMGSPEWEDADFEGCPTDQYRPDWPSFDLGGFERPRWFAQGPVEMCASYLGALSDGKTEEAEGLWLQLGLKNGTIRPDSFAGSIGRKVPAGRRIVIRLSRLMKNNWVRARSLVLLPSPLYRVAGWLHRRVDLPGWRESVGMVVAALILLALAPIRYVFASLAPSQTGTGAQKITIPPALTHWFEGFYGRRSHDFEFEMLGFLGMIDIWNKLFSHYDLVQGYATDPIWPFLADKRPYVAFEHGTLRDITRGENIAYRAAGLAYKLADHVFITNGDCLEHAGRLGITQYSPMLHPVNTRLFSRAKSEPGWAQKEYRARYVFLCPIRHDWEVKGTDVHIRAIPALRDAIGPDFCMVFIRWGLEVGRSEQLIAELRAQEQVRWIEPMAHFALARHMNAVDVVLDQIKLPHFGSTAPEALAAGVPVIMSYDPKSTEWLVSRPAPILAAWTPDQVAAQITRAVQPGFRAEFAATARRWIDECHSEQRVVETHMHVYRQLIGRGAERVPAGEPEPGRVPARQNNEFDASHSGARHMNNPAI